MLVIERERSLVDEIKQLYPFVEVKLGDACSRLTLQNITVTAEKLVFCTTKSSETNQEVARELPLDFIRTGGVDSLGSCWI